MGVYGRDCKCKHGDQLALLARQILHGLGKENQCFQSLGDFKASQHWVSEWVHFESDGKLCKREWVHTCYEKYQKWKEEAHR